tara:strand:- start:174 stop:1622 length:1449 start_codon:yes stop_codon:yes gene_type:complete
MSIIIPANSAVGGGGFQVTNGCMFEGTSNYMTKSMGTPTNTKKYTMSVWTKRCKLDVQQSIFRSTDAGNNDSHLTFNSDNTLRWQEYGGGASISSLVTTQLFRDTSAWYHIVVAYDSAQSTASDRAKMYINGTEVTAFGTQTQPSLNADSYFNKNGETLSFGRTPYGGGGNYYSGYFVETIMIDGQALGPTDFGEFDSNSGVWKPIAISGSAATPGNNGFYLNFQEASNLGNDEFGGTDFSENNFGTLNQVTDTCTNNFATMNPLSNYWTGGATFSQGNLKIATVNASKAWNMSSIGLPAGKWYMEGKFVATGGSTPSDPWNRFGIVDREPTSNSDLGASANSYALTQYDGSKYVSGTNSTYAATWTIDDIIAMAIDLDNNKIYWSKNGAWANGSGAWGSTTFNSGTGAVTVLAPTSTLNGEYFVAMGDAGTSTTKTWQFNFGNPQYSGTDKTDDNNRGSFEYTPPSGFLSICSSNLSEVLS